MMPKDAQWIAPFQPPSNPLPHRWPAFSVLPGGVGDQCKESVRLTAPYYDQWWVGADSTLEYEQGDDYVQLTASDYGNSAGNARSEGGLTDDQKIKRARKLVAYHDQWEPRSLLERRGREVPQDQGLSVYPNE